MNTHTKTTEEKEPASGRLPGIAIVDCNSFYCSCERLFRPDLRNSPVVVLSNNDGCIISRTDEAKKLGLAMGVPYYQCREQIEAGQVKVFSSNYALYGELSHRVMDCLRQLAGDRQVEVYSVDEAFVDLSKIPAGEHLSFARRLKETVEEWTGIQVSVGVGPGKTLSKLANRLAKKDKQGTAGVLLLETADQWRAALEQTPVGDLWGIGRRFARKLEEQWGISNALQLSRMPEAWARAQLGGVLGVRLIRELNGQQSIEGKEPLEKKKRIATTRMFGKPVSGLQELREAVATYTARAAEKLRRQGSAAGELEVFVVTNDFAPGDYRYDPRQIGNRCRLSRPSADTGNLIKEALRLAEELYRPGSRYLKAGVMLAGLVPQEAIQVSLFGEEPAESRDSLMETLDNINFSMRDDKVRYGATGLARSWRMKQEKRSPRYTTRWDELPELH